MLDKRRNRKMNAVLRGLAQADDTGAFDQGGMTSPGGNTIIDQPVLPDVPIDPGLVPESPGDVQLTDFSTPQPTLDLSKVGQVVQIGAQLFRYVTGTAPNGSLIAVPQPVSNSPASGTTKMLLLLAAAYFLLS